MNKYPIGSDYAKCSGDGCAKKHSCWRFLMPIKDEGLQVYYVIPTSETNKCDVYWAYKLKQSEK